MGEEDVVAPGDPQEVPEKLLHPVERRLGARTTIVGWSDTPREYGQK